MNADRLLEHFDRISDAPDAVPRLRRFVLDLAIRGKLLTQDRNDEAGVALLDRIANQPTAHARKRTRRTSQPPEQAEQEPEPFAIPSSWRFTRLAEIGELAPRNDAAPDSSSAFVPMAMISADFGVPASFEVRPWGQIRKGYTHVANGDVAVAKITPCFENGKATVFRNLPGGIGAATTELHVLRPILVDPNYILVFLKSPFFIANGISRMTGTAGQKRLPAAYFANTPFPLPPLAEQHRIVAKVDELMALCDRLEAAQTEREARRDRLISASLARVTQPASDAPASARTFARFHLDHFARLTTRPEHVKQLRQTILNLAVRGRLVPQLRHEEPAEHVVAGVGAPPLPPRYNKRSLETVMGSCGLAINHPKTVPPSGWMWVPLIRIARLESGHTPSRNRPDWWNGDVPWIGLADARIYNNGVINTTTQSTNAEGLANSAARLLPAGTVCFSRTASVGYVVIMGRAMATSQDFVNWVPTNAVTSEWIQLVLTAERPALDRFSKGAVHQTIYYPAWISMHIVLPPLAEQRRIVAKVDELMALCDQLEASLTSAATDRARLLKALLHEALAPAA